MMGQSPNGLDRSTVSRVGLAGAALGVLGIVLFIGIWLVAGSLDVAVFPRLIMAVCIPPAILATIIGAYVLLVRPGAPPQT
jgi:hypothetical protein